ncbi:MAG TPA: copper resistance protein CopC [Xanthobacteraceae bacterium]|nr:copper resistance protein CopC [Xanthobacteraceae bacterium]
MPAVTTAFAHAHLVRSTPAEDGTVKAAPSEVTLKFNERLEPSFSSAISRSSPCLLAFCATVQAAKDGPADLCSRAVSLAGGNWMFRPAQKGRAKIHDLHAGTFTDGQGHLC